MASWLSSGVVVGASAASSASSSLQLPLTLSSCGGVSCACVSDERGVGVGVGYSMETDIRPDQPTARQSKPMAKRPEWTPQTGRADPLVAGRAARQSRIDCRSSSSQLPAHDGRYQVRHVCVCKSNRVFQPYKAQFVFLLFSSQRPSRLHSSHPARTRGAGCDLSRFLSFNECSAGGLVGTPRPLARVCFWFLILYAWCVTSEPTTVQHRDNRRQGTRHTARPP